MTKLELTVNKSRLVYLQGAVKKLGMTATTVSTTTTTAKVAITWGGRDITSSHIFKLGRLAENEYVFKSEIDFAAEWRALFTAKQTTIVSGSTPL